MPIRIWICIWTLFFSAAAPASVWAKAKPKGRRRIVVVVWDGMRPDFVSARNTPVLWKLAQSGVAFRKNRSVYLSATNVNGTALVTGMYPDHTGLIANHEFRPEIDRWKPVDVENPGVVRRGDQLSHGKYIAAPTIADLVQRAGGKTVIAAGKTVGLLLDRRPVSAENAVRLSSGAVFPADLLSRIVDRLGGFPRAHPDKDNWTTKALTEIVWQEGVPTFSVLWLGEPDLTQHQTAPGAPAALRAIRSSDNNLAKVLAALDRHQVRDVTDLFVVSDHGFSTIEHAVDLPGILAGAGFNVTTQFKKQAVPGQVMVVGGGGSVLLYVMQHDRDVVRRLVEFLQQSDFAGVIFTREKLEGTFGLDRAHIDSADAPDVVLSFRWSPAKNRFGVPGMIDADWERAPGNGTHATLSRFDMHNTLIAAGPDFRAGYADDLPSGNVDVAPTILSILGIAPPERLDGRILTEAMPGRGTLTPEAKTVTFKTERSFSSGVWRQRLRISTVGRTSYLDEGNGEFEARNQAAISQ